MEHVTVRYGSVTALEDVSFILRRGDQAAVVGPNGAGKSTLFNAVAGIVKPTQGRVNIYGSGPDRHICIGYVPQRNRIDWRFPASVFDAVMMGRIGQIGLFRWPNRKDREKVRGALAQVDMLDLADRPIGDLSGGQQQRVFLARALAQEAELLLLDEPFTGLDEPSRQAILTILQRLCAAGATLLVATHDLQQAGELFPLVMLINRTLIAYGPPDQVLTSETLGRAYGSRLHIVPAEQGELVLTDTCCSGGRVPVE
ncbi:MAG: metal ABC transporter ATP-binding protein [Anaerolineae bacterium]|nr:metal ABC transporter ATP-binding protein [Anaerolineae bacterium]